jgi:uncharacterized protein (TIGR00266 family)
MLAMSPNIEISAKMPSPNATRWWGSARSSMLGESLFTAKFRARDDSGVLSLAPRLPGNILHLAATEGTSYYLAQGSFLASTSGISITYRQAGLRGILTKKGLSVLQTNGGGDLFCASYGGLIRRDLSEDESVVIDNRFVVAFSEGVQFQLIRASKDLTGGAYPGGGLVNQYTGPGQVFYQTRANPWT